MYPSDNNAYRRLRYKGVSREEAARIAGITLRKGGGRGARIPSGKGIAAITYARLMRHTVIDPRSRCWIWTGAVCKARKNLYGTVTYYCPIRKRPRCIGVHRVSAMMFHGPIPKGFDVDHDCHRSLCWNPDHIQARPKVVNRSTRGRQIRRVQWELNALGAIDTEKFRKHGVVVRRGADEDYKQNELMNTTDKTGSAWQKEKAGSNQLPAREKRAA